MKLGNLSLANVVLENFIAGVDCRFVNYRFTSLYISCCLNVLCLLITILVHKKKNQIKQYDV